MKTDDNTNNRENRKTNGGNGAKRNTPASNRSNGNNGDKPKTGNGNRIAATKKTNGSNPEQNKNSGSANRNKRYSNQRNGRNGQQKNGNHNSTSLALNNHVQDSGFFEKFATWVSKAAGTTYAFMGAIIIVVGWAIAGPFFDFSETWQLVINTGTTIITFLMVFLIQKAQNKDSLAIQLKLNELVASHEYSSNRLVDIENMTEDEMKIVQKYYRSLSELSKKEETLQTSHSIEEAEDQHESKSRRRSKRNNDNRQ